MLRNSASRIFKASIPFFFSTLKSAKNVPLKSRKAVPYLAAFGVATTLGYQYSTSAPEVDTFETTADLEDGQMRAFQVGPKEEDSVLIVKHNGKYYCTQNACPHYGFALSKGLLFGDQVMCPLHNATFSVESGHAEYGPVMNGLSTYKVTEKNGKLTIEIPKGALNKSVPSKMARKTSDANPVVIIGGGPAGLSAAETLRQAGFEGPITILSKEINLPYDRTNLSKNINAKPEGIVSRKEPFLKEYGIDVKTGSQVVSIDYSKNEVVLKNNDRVKYNQLLIASGLENVVPPIKGSESIPKLTLRTLNDLEKIREAAKGSKNVTIIGGGFIGLQLSSALKMEFKDNVNVTIVEGLSTPLERVLGPQVGKSVQSLAEKNGVKFETSAKIKEIKSSNGKAEAVELEGKSIPTDLVIFATGVKPITEFAGNIDQDHVNRGIKVDAFLRTEKPNVFAAGDVASYPYWYTGERVRVEHYNESIYQGSVAALNMLNKKMPLDNVPFFWTRSFNQSLQYTGIARNWDEVYIEGDLNSQKFLAYYIKGDKVLAVAGMNRFQAVQILGQAMKLGVLPKASVIKNSNFKVESLLPEIKSKKPGCSKCKHCA